MVWRTLGGPTAALHFEDGQEAVAYASQFMDCELRKGRTLPALVLDATKELRTSEAVLVRPDGIQQAVLRVCGKPEGFLTIAETYGANGPRLQPGDLVAWRPLTYRPALAGESGEPRMGWTGVIIGALMPALSSEGWIGAEPFTP